MIHLVRICPKGQGTQVHVKGFTAAKEYHKIKLKSYTVDPYSVYLRQNRSLHRIMYMFIFATLFKESIKNW